MKVETREEYEREYNILSDVFKDSNARLNKNLLILDNSFIKSLEQQNAELQARIKDLEEPKTCDGCIYWTLGGGCSGNFMIKCSRFPHNIDRYKPKATK